jgi:cellulose synthase (UDP-forming)
LLVALRTCWDPERSDPTPWIALPMQAKLWLRDANGQRQSRNLMIRAISETGVVPQQNQAMDGGWWPEALQLCGAALPVLPLSPQWSEEGSLRWQWTTETTAVREAFLLWLYCRPGAWPQRMAAPEWRALTALLKRLLRPLVVRESVPLSLVPQQPPPGSGGW